MPAGRRQVAECLRPGTSPCEQAPRLVKLFTVEDPAGARCANFARLKATEEAELSFRIGGQLKTLNVLQGQPVVKRGQLIASLMTPTSAYACVIAGQL